MTRIALSYRRQDSAAIAGRMFDRLVARYGDDSVFMDVDSIPFGVDFRAHLEEVLGQSDVLLVLIGANWLGAKTEGGTRINDASDPVRMEIEAAFRHETPVIPVLVERAVMPDAADLPELISRLAFLNAAEVDSGRDFRTHMDRLLGAVDKLVVAPDGATEAEIASGDERGDEPRPRDGHQPGDVSMIEPGLAATLMYVRSEEEPVLPPPRGNIGAVGWARQNLFSSIGNTILTLLGIALIVLTVPPIIRWAFIDAVWTGDGREACIVPGAGACWAFVEAKFGQFIYGRYPVEERWRVDVTAILLIIGIVLLAVPKIPYKRQTAVYLFGIFPFVALLLLTGGNFDISLWTIVALVVLGGLLTAAIAALMARAAAPVYAGIVAPAAVGIVVVVWLASFFLGSPTIDLFGTGISLVTLVAIVCAIVGLAAGLTAILAGRGHPGGRGVLGVWSVVGILVLLIGLFAIDFGLTYVETPLWGGLLVTLVVALSGMGASMPLGIALALGRRSQLPVIRFASITFIEFVRGVPLITVLFMASVMLPLFLPPGVNFDKLLRALIGVALFEAAYMAEVVRGGLQAIPTGQYEAARAVGLKYWQVMRLVVLPQALKIVIPGIVNSFISLFKDTSLVLIIGIFDLLGIVQSNFTDANWASPATPATGYVFAALVFWVFCFGMSRYSIYTERRLDTGYRN